MYLGIILSLIAAISSAFSLINLRKLKSTPVPVVVMWYSLTVVVIGSALLPVLDKWVLPSGLNSWLLILAIGAAGVLNQFFQTTAFKYESPGPISVTRSFNIVLSFVWEVTIFSEPVEWTSIAGAALITGCVIIIAMHKCYKENPENFSQLFGDIWCFARKPDMKTMPNSLRTSIDTIDQNSTILSDRSVIII